MNRKSRKLNLKKLVNARDLGGLKTADGRSVKSGRLIRSGKLYRLPERTKKGLKELGVNLIIDLRMDEECAEYPCDLWDGCKYLRLPLPCIMKAGLKRGIKMRRLLRVEGKRIKREYGNVDEYMKDMYREMVSLPEFQKVLEEFLQAVVRNDGCVLWCCTAGKDRTGISAMLLEALLGVDEERILADYTFSYRSQRNKRRLQKLGLRLVFLVPPSFRSLLIAMMNAKPEYLFAAIESIKGGYGDIVSYCKTALHITDDEIAILRNKYLE